MRRKLRVALAALVVLLGALAIVAIVERSWTAAQLRAVAVLSTTEQTPVLAWTVRALTHEPRVEEAFVGGAPSTVVRPGTGDGPWPAVVFVNGATRAGRHHEKVQRLARGLARAGFLVVVPDLPGLRLGEITLKTRNATIRAARATADRTDVRNRQIALYGVSVGATLALLAAESPALSGRVTVIGGEAPWVDLERIIRLATTGFYNGERYETDPYVQLAIARSLAAPGRPRLLAQLEAIDDDDPRPLSRLRGRQPLVRLLLNRDPARFDGLYARLPERTRRGVELLSPIRRAGRLRMRIELATAPHDKYFPPAESRALARAAPDVHVTVTSTLDHAVPNLSAGELADLARFDGFVVRFLRKAVRPTRATAATDVPRSSCCRRPSPRKRSIAHATELSSVPF
jgi:pimeloyl-ACP methyl ester carboxylesterase